MNIHDEIIEMFSEQEGYLSDDDLEGLTIENLQEKIDYYQELLNRLLNANSTDTEEPTLD